MERTIDEKLQRLDLTGFLKPVRSCIKRHKIKKNSK